ncbi:MAG TPA: hypothetical protein EYQ80_00690 [Candidatus Poseidoniales archaeon]|nr:hypothetical protein [Candidatus Poseidoniales archaeon]
MGAVEILGSGSLDGLTEGWEQYGARTRIMMLGARADRAALRNHGKTVAIAETAVSVFHRPRSERDEIAAQGLDHASASFQFVDVAIADLGRWMQPLIGQGWTRSEISITPAVGADFEAETWTCFHHPSIPLPTQIPLCESPAKMERKAFLTHPGMIEETAVASVVEPDMTTAMLKSISQTTSIPEASEETEPVPEPTAQPETPSEPIPIQEEELPPVPEQEPESPLETELRQVISLLVAGGQEMGDIMEHPQFLEVSERASAAGVDVWGMFVRLSDDT